MVIENAPGALLNFRPVNLSQDGNVCVGFFEDMLLCAFGSAQQIQSPDGKQRYLQSLREKAAEVPGSIVHAWDETRIVGQIEMSLLKTEPAVGYIHFFYLTPEWRSRGAGKLLLAYATNFLAGLGCERMRLSVSETNQRAARFYSHHGWTDIGPRQDRPELPLRLMEKAIGSTQTASV
ncbi:GNAT family N-acetyltransferase [Pseudomonas hefeiensis]|uniref:GNAT family N-acetyltransferase n=1 Tax=Pseudomonas hefeiensis TaxID=2738125 RepID=A0ABY9G8C1_9PSED|nr:MULTISPECIES: GNAT family N-acetyltransferase [unclassified Pseudomonas]WLH11849.1 GNAT family N-acetyltransferase [Pseudomonas sp. FP205]WLH94908.1 GNAT family N-acetyltransferase [Pseudomonas sp. FP53]WLI39196.1 GNAT family N-acetyltransferase [Pseudomonas sp. FP821]